LPKRVGLKDIAKALNVSVTTVSRALNNKFDINQETRIAILEKAEELNYRPNAYAVSLRKNEYFTIGVILPAIDHYFFSTVLKGIMNKAHQANYLVIIGESNHDLQREREITEQFISHCVTGVILSPSNKTSYGNNLELLKNRRIPFILVDRPISDSNHSFVRYDDPNGAFLAVEHLILQGYRRIGFIKGFDYCVISNARFHGYKKALEKYKIPFDESLIKSCIHIDSPKDGYQLTKQLLLLKSRPDAIFCVTDNVASGVYRAAHEYGFEIPKDLGIVGYSNSQISKHLTPSLSTVEQPGIEMGEQAFDFLQQNIIGGASRLERTFEARLVVRQSSIHKIPNAEILINK